MRAPVWTAVAISVGLIVLLGYFVPPEMTQFAFVLTLRSILVGWAVILAGAAALVGVLNLFLVHLGRMSDNRNPDRYSILLVISFLLSLGLGLYLTPANPIYQKVVTAIQVPVEASLMDAVDPARFAARDQRRASRTLNPLRGSAVPG